jgi:DNA mismatch endonuclease (patch repair protein)
VERDRETDQLLEDAGWAVLRFWEHDDPTASALVIRQLVGERLTGRQRPGQSRVVE